MFSRNDSVIDTDRYYIFNVGLNGNLGLAYFMTNGFLDNTTAYSRTIQATDASVIIGGFQAMNVAEVALFNSTVNMAQTRIVQEYLAAKYGLDLIGSTGVMNMFSHETYTHDLVGVGKSANLAGGDDVEHNHSTGGALELITDGLSAAGDFVMAAHNGAEISEGTNQVWSRMWNVQTAGDGGNVSMVFDFVKAGLTLEGAEGYILAHKASEGENWVDLGISATQDGDKLVFNVPAIADGYYAVGKGLPVVSTGVMQEVRGFNLYPNPAEDRVTLNFRSDRTGMVTISVYDFTGRVIVSEALMKPAVSLESTIDLAGFDSGVYVVEIREGERSLKQRLIVQ
jgi:hypothetical protein